MTASGRYLVGVDGSSAARAALAWAEAHARDAGVDCVVVRVTGDDATAARGDADGGGAAGADAAASPGDTVPEVTLVGAMPEALARYAGECDVLVVGTGKTGFIHGRVFGFRSIQIAATASSTVAVVPDLDVRFRSGVVAGIDRRDGEQVAAVAAAEAARIRQPLQLLQSRPHDPPGAPVPEPGSDPLARAMAAAERAVRGGWPWLEVRTRVVSRPPAEALLDAARGATLLVVGPGRGRAAPGRVLHDVLVNANAPVLIPRAVLPHAAVVG